MRESAHHSSSICYYFVWEVLYSLGNDAILLFFQFGCRRGFLPCQYFLGRALHTRVCVVYISFRDELLHEGLVEFTLGGCGL